MVPYQRINAVCFLSQSKKLLLCRSIPRIGTTCEAIKAKLIRTTSHKLAINFNIKCCKKCKPEMAKTIFLLQ